MYSLPPIYFDVFGALTIGGGIMGFVKAKSRASLIAGSISGVLLVAAGWLVHAGSVMPGLVLGGIVSLALVGRFAPAYRKQPKFFPAGLMALLGLGGVVVAVLGAVG